jgi:hypothetical protein
VWKKKYIRKKKAFRKGPKKRDTKNVMSMNLKKKKKKKKSSPSVAIILSKKEGSAAEGAEWRI